MAKTRRAYTGAAVSTTTSSAIAASGTTSFTITAYTGWPYGSDPFYVVVEPGTASEEKILVTRTGSTDTTINVASDSVRGLDGTSAVAHNTGSTVFPVFTAVDADEANELASKWSAKGDLVSYGSSTFEKLAVGSNGALLMADSSATSGLKWAQPGYTYVQTVYFTSSGTFTKATYPWLRAMKVTVVGGGGGGGGAQATGSVQSAEAAGGAGGGHAIKFITDIAGLSASETVTIGAGGSGGAAGDNNGVDGTSSSAFGLTGGLGRRGDGGPATAVPLQSLGRASDVGTGGDINGSGDYGGTGLVIVANSVVGWANYGGGTILTGLLNTTSSTTAGHNAYPNTGGGGAGARNRTQNATAKAGGNGAAGIVIVELYA